MKHVGGVDNLTIRNTCKVKGESPLESDKSPRDQTLQNFYCWSVMKTRRVWREDGGMVSNEEESLEMIEEVVVKYK